MSESDEWNLKTTSFGELSVHTLRLYWERNQPKANPEKSSIVLLAGDPTVFGNFKPFPGCIEAISEAVLRDEFSYDSSAGIEEACQSVAEYSGTGVTGKDVILTSGCSMALEISCRALAEIGDNILIPRPG